MIKHLLPPANKVCEGNVFTGVCLPTRGGMRGLGACVASGGMRGRARAWGGGAAWQERRPLQQTFLFMISSTQTF